jgi:hypothetical protein
MAECVSANQPDKASITWKDFSVELAYLVVKAIKTSKSTTFLFPQNGLDQI